MASCNHQEGTKWSSSSDGIGGPKTEEKASDKYKSDIYKHLLSISWSVWLSAAIHFVFWRPATVHKSLFSFNHLRKVGLVTVVAGLDAPAAKFICCPTNPIPPFHPFHKVLPMPLRWFVLVDCAPLFLFVSFWSHWPGFCLALSGLTPSFSSKQSGQRLNILLQ